jgi:large subunit ribosomal protein L14
MVQYHSKEFTGCSVVGSVSVLGIEGRMFKSYHPEFCYFYSKDIKMILKETMVIVGDNSGARRAKHIGFIGCFFKKTARIGDFIIVAIQHRRLQRRFITKNIYLAVVVTSKFNTKRLQGFYIRFCFNKVILLSEQGKVVGTRLYGPIATETRKLKIAKIISLAKIIL